MQKELLPSADATGPPWSPPGAVPPACLKFERFVDTTSMRPGDLVLVRETNPDLVSTAIETSQVRGGYFPVDARWTHAAMYLGDKINVVEATIEANLKRHVGESHLGKYCDGKHVLRCRRSPRADGDEGWLLAMRALTESKHDYSLKQIKDLWIQARDGYWGDGVKLGLPFEARTGLVCSQLYQIAFFKMFKVGLNELNGICLPAYLSMSTEFRDVQLAWRPIDRT